MNNQIMQWIQAELAGLYGASVISEMNEIIRCYRMYDGSGQTWTPQTDGTYTPARVITNFIKKLINDESRFMVSRAPEIKIVPLDKDRKAEAEALQNWLDRVLQGTFWQKRLLHGVRDAMIGKRVALKLTGAPGIMPKIRFAPSLEFVFETDEDDVDKVKKCIFFYEVTPENVIDHAKQRIWRQRYEMKNGRCYLDEGLYDGYGRPIRIDHDHEDTGLDFVPVYIIINGGLSGDLSGESDVQELADSQNAYNRMKSDDIDALKYNMFPQKVITDASQESADAIRIAPNALWDLQTEPSNPGAKASATVLESTFNYDVRLQNCLGQLRQDMHSLLSVPEVGADVLKGIGVSGKAMRALYWELICRCNEKWADGWDDAIKWMVDKLLRMARRYGESLPEIEYAVHIEHLYPLIDDEEEERERDLSEVMQKARSRRSYIDKWQGVEDPDEELAQIRKESQLLEDAWTAAVGRELSEA